MLKIYRYNKFVNQFCNSIRNRMKVTTVVLNIILLFSQSSCDELNSLRICPECVQRQVKKGSVLTAPKCLECMCDLDCIVYGDCCIDVLIQNNLHTKQPDTGYQCIAPYSDSILRFRHIDKNKFGFYMKYMYQSTNKQREICSNDVFPVTCLQSGVTYNNAECAYFNNELNCVDWTLESECRNTAHGVQCAIYLVPPVFADLRVCDILRSKELISECQHGSRQEETERCKKYFYPVYNDEKNVYRNLFCYKCNGNGISGIRGEKGNVFTALTSFTDQFNRAVSPCDGNSAWMDVGATKCRDINCSSDKRLDGGYCLPDNRTAINNLYSIKGRLMLPTQYRIPFIKQLIGYTFNFLTQSLYSTEYYLSASPQYSFNNKNLQVDLQIWFKITANMSLEKFEKSILAYSSKNTIWRISFCGFFSVIYTPDFSFMVTTPENPVLKPDTKTGLCCKADKSMSTKPYQYEPHVPEATAEQFSTFKLYVVKVRSSLLLKMYEPITYQLTCSYIQFEQDEYFVQPNKSALIPHLDLLLFGGEFSITDTKLAVCFELFLKKTDFEYTNETTFYDNHKNVSYSKPLWYVTIACLTVSLVSILFTFITYYKFPEMRTQPGINNMALCLNMFLAQMMLLMGAGRSNQVILCQVLGILIHYLWLSMLFWMNVCSYHMFKVFVFNKLIRNITSKSVFQTIRYCLYGNGISLLIVVTTIVTNITLSTDNNLGYGGMVCYLSSKMLVLYCFVIPLCLVIVSNIVFFLSTIITIHRVKAVGKQSAERKNIYIYLKLSVVTGIFWTVALLSNFIQHVTIDYISVILNASQGFFLLWSFILNKLVLNKWKQAFIQSSESSSQGVTDTSELKSISK